MKHEKQNFMQYPDTKAKHIKTTQMNWENETQPRFYSSFHLSELTSQTIPVAMRIFPLIKPLQPDHSNPK